MSSVSIFSEYKVITVADFMSWHRCLSLELLHYSCIQKWQSDSMRHSEDHCEISGRQR